MTQRFGTFGAFLILVAGCGGSGSPMTEDAEMEDGGTVVISPDEFSSVQSIFETQQGEIGLFPTPIASVSGSAEYAGSASVQRSTGADPDIVSFIAIGEMDATINFGTRTVTADADSFFQLDPSAFSAGGAIVSQGPVDGSLSYAATLDPNSPLVFAPFGASSGGITDRSGNFISLDLTGGTLAFNDNADLLVISGPSFNSETDDPNEPGISYSLIGTRID